VTLRDDRLAILDLVQAYAINADRRDADNFAACFAPDARLHVIDPSSAVLHRYDGRDEIRTIPGRLARYDRTLHHVTTHHASIDGTTATGVTYCSAHHITVGVDGTATNRVLEIRYIDRFVRTAGGWVIADREVRTDWTEERPVSLDR
jgi:ketosteroid isomerase-like protein